MGGLAAIVCFGLLAIFTVPFVAGFFFLPAQAFMQLQSMGCQSEYCRAYDMDTPPLDQLPYGVLASSATLCAIIAVGISSPSQPFNVVP